MYPDPRRTSRRLVSTLAAGLILVTPSLVQRSIPGSHARAAGLGGAAGGVGGAVGGVGGAVGNAAGGAVSGVGSAAGGAVGNVGGAVGGAVGNAGNAVGGAVSGVGSAAGGAVGNVGGAVGGAVGNAGNAVGGAVSGVGSAVGGAVGNSGGAVGGVAGTVGGGAGGAGLSGGATAGRGAASANPGRAGPSAPGASSPSNRSVGTSTASRAGNAIGGADANRPDLLFLRHGNGGEKRANATRRSLNPAQSAVLAIDPSPKSSVVKRRLARQEPKRGQIASIATVRLAGAIQATRPIPVYQEGVILASGVTALELAALVAQKFSLLDSVDGPNTVYKLGTPPGIGTPEALAVVRKASPVINADFDHFYTLSDRHSICSLTGCRPFQSAVRSRSQSPSCGKLPTIGMVDTAIDPKNKIFASAAVVALGEYSMATANSHGTHVASLLAAATDNRVPGLLPTARLIAYNAFSSQNGRDVADALSLCELSTA